MLAGFGTDTHSAHDLSAVGDPPAVLGMTQALKASIATIQKGQAFQGGFGFPALTGQL